MFLAMDAAHDIAEFLTSRRARVTPEQAGLPTWGPRRVKGLRREEVASLAGVSVEYYKRLERGNAGGVSDSVLEALAHALQLEDAERAHLFDLARAASPVAAKRRRPARLSVRPVVLRVLDSISAPAIVRNSRVDYLAANPLGRALYAPDDRGLSDLVGELSTRSPEFGTWWAAHNVRYHRTGTKRLRHPVVGELELDYKVMDVSADDGLTIAVYSAESDSRSAQALDLLASWTATAEPAGAPVDE
jgi:transcriptional regulator with XRE-family HTH domain